MPEKDNISALYNTVSSDYDLGTIDDFKAKLQDPSNRKAFYETVGKEYDLGDYTEFESRITPTKEQTVLSTEKKNEISPLPSPSAGVISPSEAGTSGQVDTFNSLAPPEFQPENNMLAEHMKQTDSKSKGDTKSLQAGTLNKFYTDKIFEDSKNREVYYKALGSKGYDITKVKEVGEGMAKYKNDLVALQENISKNPNDIHSLASIGDIQAAIGDNDRAIGTYNEVLSKVPNDTKSAYGMAFTLMKMGDDKNALDAFNKLIEMDPNSSKGYNGKAYLEYKKGGEENIKQALIDVNKSIGLNPNSGGENYLNRASILSSLGRKDEAEKDFEKAKDLIELTEMGQPLSIGAPGTKEYETSEKAKSMARFAESFEKGEGLFFFFNPLGNLVNSTAEGVKAGLEQIGRTGEIARKEKPHGGFSTEAMANYVSGVVKTGFAMGNILVPELTKFYTVIEAARSVSPDKTDEKKDEEGNVLIPAEKWVDFIMAAPTKLMNLEAGKEGQSKKVDLGIEAMDLAWNIVLFGGLHQATSKPYIAKTVTGKPILYDGKPLTFGTKIEADRYANTHDGVQIKENKFSMGYLSELANKVKEKESLTTKEATDIADIMGNLTGDDLKAIDKKISEQRLTKQGTEISAGKTTENPFSEISIKVPEDVKAEPVDLTGKPEIIKTPEPQYLSSLSIGDDVRFQGKEGKLSVNEDGAPQIDLGDGKFIDIPVEDKNNLKVPLKEIGLEPMPKITQEEIAIAHADAEVVDTFKSPTSGNEIFISLANPKMENTVGDMVGRVMPDGSIKRLFTEDNAMSKAGKLDLINQYLESKGLPKRKSLVEVEKKAPIETKPVVQEKVQEAEKAPVAEALPNPAEKAPMAETQIPKTKTIESLKPIENVATKEGIKQDNNGSKLPGVEKGQSEIWKSEGGQREITKPETNSGNSAIKSGKVKEEEVSKEQALKDRVTSIGEKLKEKLRNKNTPEGTQKSGVDVDSLIDTAVDIIHKGIDAKVELSKLIDKAVEHIKSKWDKEVDGEFPESDIREILSESAPKESDVSGIKKSLVSKDILESVNIEKISDKEMHDIGKSLVDNGDVHPESIVKEIMKQPRALQPNEVVASIYYKRVLDNKISDAYSEKAKIMESDGDPLAINSKINALEESRLEFDTMALITANQQSMAFRLRKGLLDKDFNLVDQINKYKSTNKGVIPKEVEAAFKENDRKLTEVKDKLEKAEKRAIEAEEKLIISNIEDSIAREKSKEGKLKTPSLSKEKALRKKELKSKYSGIFNDVTRIPTLFLEKEFREYAGLILEEAAGDFNKFQKQAIEELGKKIKPYLPDLFKSLGGKMPEALAEIKQGKISISKSLIRELVEGGAKDINELTKQVQEAIKDDYPNATEREVRDAITNYGKTVNLSKDAIETEIRKMLRIGKSLSKLEDIKNGKRPLLSGLLRDKLSTEERALQREIKEGLKDLPEDAAHLEKTLKSANDVIKTRLENEIADIERQIEKGEREPRKKGVEHNAENKELQKQRNELRDELNKLLPRPELTQEQVNKIAVKSLEKRIEAISERIESRTLELKKEGVKYDKNDPVIKSATERLNKGKEILNQLREDAGIPERIRIEQSKKAVKKQIEILKEKIRINDFSKSVKKSPITPDADILSLRSEKIKYQEVYEKMQYENQLKNREPWDKIVDAGREALNLPRAMIASLDMSAVLVQGLIRTVTKPKQTIYSLKEMFKQMSSEKYQEAWIRDIKSADLYQKIKASDLYISEHNVKMSAREEQFISGWVNHVWDALGKPIDFASKSAFEKWKELNPYKAAERAYTGYVNAIRVSGFAEGAKYLEQEGKSFETHPEEYKSWASYVNNATGRGGLGKFEDATKALQVVFFSPRKIMSRINLISPVFYYKLSPTARKMALRNFASFIGVTTAAVALAKAGGAEVETDPKSSDFMKIKIGDTRIDLWGGFQQEIVLAARLITGETKTTTNGEIKKLGEGINDNELNLIENFFYNKFAPTPAIGLRLLGRAPKGDEVTLKAEVIRNTIPIYAQDLKDLYAEQDKVSATALTLLALFGGSISTYDTRKIIEDLMQKRLDKQIEKTDEEIEADYVKSESDYLIKEAREESLKEEAKIRGIQYVAPDGYIE